MRCINGNRSMGRNRRWKESMRSWCIRLGGVKTAIGPSMKMQSRQGPR